MRTIDRRILAALGLAGLLTGCSGGSMAQQLPAEFGMPQNVPAKPATSYDYPAVHDMPPPRATKPLTEEQQIKLEQDLTATRTRQEALNPGKKATRAVKKTPAAAKNARGDGSKTNP